MFEITKFEIVRSNYTNKFCKLTLKEIYGDIKENLYSDQLVFILLKKKNCF